MSEDNINKESSPPSPRETTRQGLPSPASKTSISIDLSDPDPMSFVGKTEADVRASMLADMRKALDERNVSPDADRLEAISAKIESGYYAEVATRPDVIQLIMNDLLGTDPSGADPSGANPSGANPSGTDQL